MCESCWATLQVNLPNVFGVQPDVRAVFVIVGQIITPKPPEMLLVQWDDVIEYFAARTSDRALGDSVLPGASSTGANGSNATGFQELENIATEFAIPVEQDVPVGAGEEEEPGGVVARSNRSSGVS